MTQVPMEELARELSPTQVRITEAAIRVIAQRGFDVVSVRTAATESGLSAGTVQHHFPTRQNLLVATLAHSAQRQAMRIEEAVRGHSRSGDRSFRRTMVVGLRELLPREGERFEDAAVWVSYGAAASTRGWLAELYWAVVLQFRDGVRAALERAHAAGRLREGITPGTATPLVTALVNGLTLDLLNAPAAEHDGAEEALDRGLRLILTD